MKLHQLKVLVTICESGNFQEAYANNAGCCRSRWKVLRSA